MESSLKKVLTLGIVALFCLASAFAGTVTGTVQNAASGPVANGTFGFTLTQGAMVVGTANVVPTTVNCYTDGNGNLVGEPNPLALPVVSSNLGSGTLAAGVYFVRLTYQDATGETVASPEVSFTMTGIGTLIVTAPLIQPAGVTAYRVYISTATGTETLQGSVTVSPGSWGNYSQSVPLTVPSGALPVSNTTACKLRFNDEMTPSFTGYNVTLTSTTGQTIPGYPQTWYLAGGSAGTINITSGTPLYSGSYTVQYPQAIVTTPPFNAAQSINGPLNLNGFALQNVAAFSPANLITTAPNPATSGYIRMAPGDTECWRNTALNADVCLSDAGAASSSTGNLADLLKWNGGGYQAAAFVDRSAAPANSGVVRTGNNVCAVASRNAAGNGDVCAVQVNALNQTVISNVSATGLTTNRVAVATDFTTANNTNLQNIPGLSWSFPATAANYSFHCALLYSQATAAVADTFGIQAVNNAPTNIAALGDVALSISNARSAGNLATLTTTTGTAFVGFTPTVTATTLNAYLDGTLELGASTNTVNIMVSTGAGADAITIKRGSYCNLF
jgi:hypothetical protein